MTVISRLRRAGVECYTREQWGSPRERDGSYARRRLSHPMPNGPAPYHFLHITVTADTDTKLEGAEGARKVESFGLSTPPMVSYQDLVTNEGRYFQGQNYGVKGTHTINDKNVPGYPNNLNMYGYATAIMQNVDDAVTEVQVQVIAMIFAARELEGLVRRGAPVFPHRKFDWKLCPGDKAVARLPEIIKLKNQYVREGLPTLNEEDEMNPAQERLLQQAADSAARAEKFAQLANQRGKINTRAILFNRDQSNDNYEAIMAELARIDAEEADL
jgi:hypothetical protein